MRCGFPSMKTICNFGFNQKFNFGQYRNIYMLLPQTHWPGLWRKDNKNWEIFVEFQVSILLTKIFCWMVTCTLPASINCVYSFNEFMCLWCGLKVKLIPDAGERTHYYRDHKILWTIYYQNCSWVKISWWCWWWHYSRDATLAVAHCSGGRQDHSGIHFSISNF